MKLVIPLAVISASLLALFLWFRPVIGALGAPVVPEVSGNAARRVPDGTAGLSAASVASPVAGAPAALTAKPSAADLSRLGISHAEQVEKVILDLTNAERQKMQLPALLPDKMLEEAAREHSDDMMARDFFDHVNPDGQTSGDRVSEEHRRLIGLSGENISRGTGLNLSDPAKVAEQIVDGWMKSTGHRENILRPEYTHLGVGVSVRGKEVRATQNFAGARAFIDQDVPAQVQKGGSLNLSATASGGGGKPEEYGFFDPNKGTNPDRRFKITDNTVQIDPGTYKLWFYFPKPEGGGYVIYYGPRVEIK